MLAYFSQNNCFQNFHISVKVSHFSHVSKLYFMGISPFILAEIFQCFQQLKSSGSNNNNLMINLLVKYFAP